MFTLLSLWACVGEAVPPTRGVLAELAARPLVLTRHGACRMACRGVDEADLRAVLARGTLIPERTRTDGQCPSHAVEGRGADGDRLRLVFAACPAETRLVTAIDLDHDGPCDCP